MPQMSPLLWTNLYIFFTIVFMMIVIMNFFIKPPIKITQTVQPVKMEKMNWKW